MKVLLFDWGGVINLTGHASLISRQIEKKYNIPYMKIIEVLVPLWKELNRDMIDFTKLCNGVNSGLNLEITENEMTSYLENSFD